MPGVAHSKFIRGTPERALATPDLPKDIAQSGSTTKMNLFQAVNHAMDIALGADETAGTFLGVSLARHPWIQKSSLQC